jgi:hypothetical protein
LKTPPKRLVEKNITNLNETTVVEERSETEEVGVLRKIQAAG